MSLDDEIDDDAFEAEIAPLSEAVRPGTAAALDAASEAYVTELGDDGPRLGSAVLSDGSAFLAFSYADAYEFCLRDPETGCGCDGTLILEVDETGVMFTAAGTVSLLGSDETHGLEGEGCVEDSTLLVTLAVEGGAEDAIFDMEIEENHDAPWLVPIGDVQFQQAPEDPSLNGGLQLNPTKPEKSRGTFTVIKLPRRDAEGKPVYTGFGKKRRQVFDHYFHRNGRWWRILDPKLYVKGSRTLIDLRDGTPNKNWTEADDGAASRLDRMFFPTDADEFWKGFNEATRRQLQGLAITIATTSGQDLSLWINIKRARDEGKSWSEIWDAFWPVILVYLLNAGLKSTALAKLLSRVFGPFSRRVLDRLSKGKPPPPTPPGGPSIDWVKLMRQHAQNLLDEIEHLKKIRKKLERTPPYTESFRVRLAKLNRIDRELNKRTVALEAARAQLRKMGGG